MFSLNSSELPAFPAFLNPQQFKNQTQEGAKTKTTSPIVTGTSIVGIKYKDGVMIGADTLGSYGSLAKFRNVQRVRGVGDHTVVAGSGEYSDYQYIMDTLEKQIDSDFRLDDDYKHTPKDIHQYLIRTMYNRRNKFDPLWNTLVVGGFRNDKSFLGLVDLVGTHFEENTIATGYGAYIAQPLLRNYWTEKKGVISEQEAKAILEKCLRVLFYRDARSSSKIQIAKIDSQGVSVSEPYVLDTKWDYKGFL